MNAAEGDLRQPVYSNIDTKHKMMMVEVGHTGATGRCVARSCSKALSLLLLVTTAGYCNTRNF